MKLASVIIVCALFSSNIAHSDPVINNEYVPVAEAIGGASGVRINSDGEYVFYNEKPYAVTAEVLMSDNTIVAVTLPPRSTGPIETASGILDQPVSTLASYLTGSFGQSEVNAGTLTTSEIKSITYVGGRDEAQLLNLAYLATSTIQTTAQALSFSGNDKAVFDLVGETIIKKITSEEVSGRILQKMSNGCGFLTSCRSFLSKELKSITLEVIEEIATSVLFEEILFVNGVSSSDTSDFLLRKTPVIKALDYLTILENFGDIGALLSGTVAFSGTPTTLRVQTVTDDDLAPPLQYNYDEFPEIIAQIEVIEEPVFLSAPNDPSNIPEALVATAPDLTDDIIADLVEETDPDTPVTPDPVLVGVFSGVNGTPSSNLAIQGKLGSITETSTGNISFEWPVDECVSGCTVTGTTPASEASSYQYLSWGTLSQTVRMTDLNTGIAHDIQNMRWLYGDATSSDYLNTRTGTASYAGQIYGDFTEGGVTQYNTITGGIGLSFNFSDDSLSGQAYFSQGGVPQEGFDIAGGLVSFGGQQHLRADLTSQDPNTSGSITSGGLLGTFYGPEANEVGGAIWAFGTASEHDEAFSVAGVFVARTGETFVMPTIDYGNITPPVTPAFTQVYTGHARGYWPTYSNNSSQQARLKNSQLYTTSNAQDALAVGQNELSANQSFHTSGNSGLVIETSAATRGSYSFTDWGTWDNASATVLDRNGAVANRGHWIIGANTHESQIPRSGTATYNGEAVGTDHTGASITGTARLQADFSADTIDAQLDLNKNGSSWASVTFAPMGIVAPSDSSAIGETRVFSGHVGNGDGAITGLPSSSDAFIGGAFYGDQAQEVGGYWDISDTTGDGTFTGAEGVFRATQ